VDSKWTVLLSRLQFVWVIAWHILLPAFTHWQAVSSDRTQAFLLVGTLVRLPMILMYTGLSYWVSRGKVHGEIGYH
jgi:cytochrome bd-type quinol oxidase subunit 2